MGFYIGGRAVGLGKYQGAIRRNILCTGLFALSAMTATAALAQPKQSPTERAPIIALPYTAQQGGGDPPVTIKNFTVAQLIGYCTDIDQGRSFFEKIDATRFQLTCTAKPTSSAYQFDTIKLGQRTFVFIEKIINFDETGVTSIESSGPAGALLQSYANEYEREGWNRK